MKIKQKEFCTLTGLTRKALLIYEQKDILKPRYVNPETGYRYYTENEVERAVKIKLLKNLGQL